MSDISLDNSKVAYPLVDTSTVPCLATRLRGRAIVGTTFISFRWTPSLVQEYFKTTIDHSKVNKLAPTLQKKSQIVDAPQDKARNINIVNMGWLDSLETEKTAERALAVSTRGVKNYTC